MIKFGKYTVHTFLSPWWCKKLREAGITMENAVWFYVKKDNEYYIVDKDEVKEYSSEHVIPTYTLADILYLLNEYPFVNDVGAPLGFLKDAPFYVWTYYFQLKEGEDKELPTFNNGKSYIEAEGETPLEGAARMLLMCKANDIFVPSWSIDDKYDEIWDYEQAMEKQREEENPGWKDLI